MSAERPHSYNKLPTDHEAVIQYQPTFIARGGDHLVYEAKGHPDTVIKASTFKIQNILSDNVERGLPLDGISDEIRTELEKEIEDKNAQIRQYREYFGTEHTLSERRYLMQVPISTEIAQEIFADDWKGRKVPEEINSINEVWTAAVIQKKSPEVSNPEHLGLYFGGFIEERKIQPSSSEYDALNDAFLGTRSITPEDLEHFFKTQDNPETHALADLVAKAEVDHRLKETAEDFIRKAIHFANETGNILALANVDNVILFPKGDEWNYLLIDAIPIYNDPIYKLAKEAKVRSQNGEELTEENQRFITRALNFVRTMNGLAAALGMEERLVF
ncbi:hypothetical protein BH11PAT2_BH11PAT2_01190 [soil metagenome]